MSTQNFRSQRDLRSRPTLGFQTVCSPAHQSPVRTRGPGAHGCDREPSLERGGNTRRLGGSTGQSPEGYVPAQQCGADPQTAAPCPLRPVGLGGLTAALSLPQAIENIDALTSLESLFLGKNKITKLQNLDALTSLTVLSMQVPPCRTPAGPGLLSGRERASPCVRAHRLFPPQ